MVAGWRWARAVPGSWSGGFRRGPPQDRPPGETGPSKASGWRFALSCLLAAAGLGLAVWQVAPTLAASGGLQAWAGLSWPWLFVAAVLGTASLVLYGVLYRLLLGSAGEALPTGTVVAITFVQNSFTDSLPSGGGMVSAGYAVTAFHRRGVQLATSMWVVAMGSAVAAVTLLVATPVLLASARLLPLPAALGISAAFALAVWAGWRLVHAFPVLRQVTRAVLVVARRVPVVRRAGWVAREPAELAGQVNARLGHMRPRGREWALLIGSAVAGLGSDYLAVASCITATSQPVPWPALAVGYLAVQVSIAAQLTPGGTGPAEAGLLAALVHGGLDAGAAALAVVTYRGITWLGLAAAGWVVFPLLSGRGNPRREPGGGTQEVR